MLLGGLRSPPVALGHYSRLNGMFHVCQRCSEFLSLVMKLSQMLGHPLHLFYETWAYRVCRGANFAIRGFPNLLQICLNLLKFASILLKFAQICSNLLQNCSKQHFTTLYNTLQHFNNTLEKILANSSKIEANFSKMLAKSQKFFIKSEPAYHQWGKLKQLIGSQKLSAICTDISNSHAPSH